MVRRREAAEPGAARARLSSAQAFGASTPPSTSTPCSARRPAPPRDRRGTVTKASARALPGARYGAIVTVDEEGAPRDPVFSSLAPEEERELLARPGCARRFEHLRARPGPVRVAEFPAYVRALGIDSPWTFSRTFQGTPMRRRGLEAGSFFLVEKADGDLFTDADEVVLVLLASQAASVIANTRTHRRTRADTV